MFLLFLCQFVVGLGSAFVPFFGIFYVGEQFSKQIHLNFHPPWMVCHVQLVSGLITFLTKYDPFCSFFIFDVQGVCTTTNFPP